MRVGICVINTYNKEVIDMNGVIEGFFEDTSFYYCNRYGKIITIGSPFFLF
jgi:hypothetical protein